MSDRFIVIVRRLACTCLQDIHMETEWDGQFYDSRKAAISAGWKDTGSDDFNIGVVRDGRLISIDWMDEPLNESAETLADIEAEIYLYEDGEEATPEAPSSSLATGG